MTIPFAAPRPPSRSTSPLGTARPAKTSATPVAYAKTADDVDMAMAHPGPPDVPLFHPAQTATDSALSKSSTDQPGSGASTQSGSYQPSLLSPTMAQVLDAGGVRLDRAEMRPGSMIAASFHATAHASGQSTPQVTPLATPNTSYTSLPPHPSSIPTNFGSVSHGLAGHVQTLPPHLFHQHGLCLSEPPPLSSLDTPVRLVKPDQSVFSFSGYTSKIRQPSLAVAEPGKMASPPHPTPQTPSKRNAAKKFLVPVPPTPLCTQSSPTRARHEHSLDGEGFMVARPSHDAPPSTVVKSKVKTHRLSADGNSPLFAAFKTGPSGSIFKKFKSLAAGSAGPNSVSVEREPRAGPASSRPPPSPASFTAPRVPQPFAMLSSSPVLDGPSPLHRRQCEEEEEQCAAADTTMEDVLAAAHPASSAMPHGSSLDSDHWPVHPDEGVVLESPFLSSDPPGPDVLSPVLSRRIQQMSRIDTSLDATMDAEELGPDLDADEDEQDLALASLNLRHAPWLTTYPHVLDAAYFTAWDGVSGFAEGSGPSAGPLDPAAPDYFSEHFDLVAVIGHGSFADVFKVVSKSPEPAEYAIKKTRQPFSGLHDRARKLEEPQAMLRLPPHPNCLRLYQTWEQQGHLYLLMEFCEGGSLAQFIDRSVQLASRVDEPVIWHILHDLAQGLAHIHAHGMVHLDLKPENILIDREGVLKIADFGLTKQLGRAHDFDMEGDKVYLAPEVLQGVIGPAADLFSLGLMALELAANIDLPSQGDSWQRLRAGQFDDLGFDTCISHSLVSLIFALLDPDPAKRPSAESVLRVAQQAILA